MKDVLQFEFQINIFHQLLNLCICCDEILKGGNKQCIDCRAMKDINDFERPYLVRCKKCSCLRVKKYSAMRKEERLLQDDTY